MAFRVTLRSRRKLTLLVMSVGAGGGICLPLGLLTAFVSVLKGTTVLSQQGMAHVSVGYPFHWVTQNQTFFSPPRFPTQASFENPHHSPTHLMLSGLIADTVFWAIALWLTLMVLFGITLLMPSGIRRSRRGTAGPAMSLLG